VLRLRHGIIKRENDGAGKVCHLGVFELTVCWYERLIDMKLIPVAFGLTVAAAVVVAQSATNRPAQTNPGTNMTNSTNKTEAEWRKELTPEQYRVLREKGTERAFTGEYWDNHAAGEYRCAGCGTMLFRSEAKFDSGCGWPSFDRPADKTVVSEAHDATHYMERTEVICAKCGGHLGHVFDDGPRATTGLRYCINSASLKFDAATNAPTKK
jgi:peptide-methionine (R)-S-oxide reductase